MNGELAKPYTKQYIKPIYYDTLSPYCVVEHTGIKYTVCKDYRHISRYKGLRQLVHNPNGTGRFITPEVPNPIISNVQFVYYDVPATEENRLDLIAYKFFGSAQYSWIISYFNNIEDGYSVNEGQRLKILKNFTDLFSSGELLAPIPAMQLNLGEE